jgi:hypothetical protein
MPLDAHSDEEVDPELERQQVEAEAQRDMYRGENIDHLRPDSLSAAREEYFARCQGRTGDDDSNRREYDQERTDDNDKVAIYAAEETVVAKVVDPYDEDIGGIVEEPDLVTSTNSNDPAVLAAKLPEELMYLSPVGAFLEFEDQPVLEWPNEDTEDDARDFSHMFEHASINLVDGE